MRIALGSPERSGPGVPSGRARLDVELVRRGLARSRDHAVELVARGRVRVGGVAATKASRPVTPDDQLEVDDTGSDFVSRGGHKLAGALSAFGPHGLTVEGRRCLDAGASTGGFTEVLLRSGATRVVAVDVGRDQLVPALRAHPLVDVHERTHVRDLRPEQVGGTVDLLVADLSFISLTVVMPALRRLVEEGGDLVLLVKPQFEVGKSRLGRGGVVRDRALRHDAIRGVARAAAEVGLGVAGLTVSPIQGPAGNTEYFLWLRADAPSFRESALDTLETPDQDSEPPKESPL